MKKESLSYQFQRALNEKYPIKSRLVDDISNFLDIEKVSVYRRLRGEISFTSDEMGALARRYNVSLDMLVREEVSDKSKYYFAFDYGVAENGYFNTGNLNFIISNLKVLNEFPSSRVECILRSFPVMFYKPYAQITKFLHYKEKYYCSHENNDIRYDDISIPDDVQAALSEIYELYSNIEVTHCILSLSAIQDLVNDIKFFRSIYNISDENVAALKNEMLLFLDDLEELLVGGKYLSTNKPIYVYLLPLNVGINSGYMSAGEWRWAMLDIHMNRWIYTYDKDGCQMILRWIANARKFSSLISITGKHDRMQYLVQQREMIEAEL